MTGVADTSADAGAVEALLGGRLADPHSLLGAHPVLGGVVVRAFRPGAEAVRVLPEGGGASVELMRIRIDGLFEGVVEGASLPLRYRIETTYGDGRVEVADDPYRFPPTVGELDLHLTGEGRHERVYERLGAHVREVDGVEGVSFAVWAPNARAVALVGDFNRWDGRLQPMRSLGPSGIWELFVPSLASGERYKFAIHRPDGSVTLKADPYAFQAEEPPKTASIVDASTHEWSDREWLEGRSLSAAARGSDVDLRGAPRLLAPRPPPGPTSRSATAT